MDSDFVSGGQGVGKEHCDFFVQCVRQVVEGGVGKRGAHVLGESAVDHVAENPGSTVLAVAVKLLLAVLARAASGNARDKYFVAGLEVLHCLADGFDGADAFVAEDASVPFACALAFAFLNFGVFAMEDAEVGAADGGGVDADDRCLLYTSDAADE